uniref:Ig-like domain-containing protein n=1 Tax=Xiphophorus maculatus TaxID=8083 RepID=A0A3B5QAX2_XIPMA
MLWVEWWRLMRGRSLSCCPAFTLIIHLKIRSSSGLAVISVLTPSTYGEKTVTEGSDSVVLPCTTSSHLPEDTSVEWTRSEPEFMMVHSSNQRNQDGFYRDRTEMNKDFLRTGDVSLTLRNPTHRDDGRYVCTVYRDQDVLRHTVVLKYLWGVDVLVLPHCWCLKARFHSEAQAGVQKICFSVGFPQSQNVLRPGLVALSLGAGSVEPFWLQLLVCFSLVEQVLRLKVGFGSEPATLIRPGEGFFLSVASSDLRCETFASAWHPERSRVSCLMRGVQPLR